MKTFYFIFFCLCTLRAYVRSYNKAITYLLTILIEKKKKFMVGGYYLIGK